jgi:hypothetical protein
MTNRAIAAKANRSPFFDHEPKITPDEPTALNFPPYMRQIFRSIFESMTQEEVATLFKLIRNISLIIGDVNLEEIASLFKLSMAVAKTFIDPKLASVNGDAQAYAFGWKGMQHYRQTGEIL